MIETPVYVWAAVLLGLETFALYQMQSATYALYLSIFTIIIFALCFGTLLLRISQVDIIADKVADSISFHTTISTGKTLSMSKKLSDLTDIRIKVIKTGRQNQKSTGESYALVFIFNDESNVQVIYQEGKYEYQQHLQQLNQFIFNGKLKSAAGYLDQNQTRLVPTATRVKVHLMTQILNGLYLIFFINVIYRFVLKSQIGGDESQELII